MARIFQKYVTPEGRTGTPPPIVEEALRRVTSGPEEVTETKLGGPAITFGDLGMASTQTPEAEDEMGGMNIDSAISMYLMMKGIRNMIQYFAKLSGFAGGNGRTH